MAVDSLVDGLRDPFPLLLGLDGHWVAIGAFRVTGCFDDVVGGIAVVESSIFHAGILSHSVVKVKRIYSWPNASDEKG